jgi:hypothetical protein
MVIHIRRREFIATFGGAAAWPLVARISQNDFHCNVSLNQFC